MNDVDSGADIRITDTLITLSKLKDGKLCAIVISVNKIVFCNQTKSTISFNELKESKIFGSILNLELNSESVTHKNEFLVWNSQYAGNVQVNGCSCVQLTGCLVEDETTNESTLVFELTKVRSAINFLHDCVLSNSQLHLELKAIVCP